MVLSAHRLILCFVSLFDFQQWFPATVMQYNGIKNQVLLSYEDEDEHWHTVDTPAPELTPTLLTSGDFESTFDNKKIKYRIVALAVDGEGAVRKYGDDSDFDVEDGKGFPPIPPPRAPSRQPKLVCNTHVSLDVSFYTSSRNSYRFAYHTCFFYHVDSETLASSR